jgi:hypothetical protein
MYLALSFKKKDLEESQAAQDNVANPGFFKIDTETKQILGEISYGPYKTGGEVFF